MQQAVVFADSDPKVRSSSGDLQCSCVLDAGAGTSLSCWLAFTVRDGFAASGGGFLGVAHPSSCQDNCFWAT